METLKENQFNLTHNGEVVFTGSEGDCYMKLQKSQSQSADWAIKYEGWKVEEVPVLSDYDQQAEDFLTKTNTTFKAEFKRNDLYFTGDKDKRDIYEITLKRGDREFIFEFGESLNNSGFYYTKGRQKIELDRKLLETKNLGSYIKNKLDWSFLNNGKSDIVHIPAAPTAYSVLACLTKYDCGTFEDFCSEFGYDSDSRTAEKTYKAVCNEWLNVQRLFNDTEIEILQEIS